MEAPRNPGFSPRARPRPAPHPPVLAARRRRRPQIRHGPYGPLPNPNHPEIPHTLPDTDQRIRSCSSRTATVRSTTPPRSMAAKVPRAPRGQRRTRPGPRRQPQRARPPGCRRVRRDRVVIDPPSRSRETPLSRHTDRGSPPLGGWPHPRPDPSPTGDSGETPWTMRQGEDEIGPARLGLMTAAKQSRVAQPHAGRLSPTGPMRDMRAIARCRCRY